MLLVVVYVGAVAVLFLFVVMMLDIDFVELREGFLTIGRLRLLIGVILFAELRWLGRPAARSPSFINSDRIVPGAETNTEAIGAVMLHAITCFYFQLAGVILLVAMIGAIVLTLRHRPDVKRQNVAGADRPPPRRCD